MATLVKIEGMGCEHCVKAVTEALRGLQGVRDVKVDLANGQASLEHDQELHMDSVREAIEKAGYRVG